MHETGLESVLYAPPSYTPSPPMMKVMVCLTKADELVGAYSLKVPLRSKRNEWHEIFMRTCKSLPDFDFAHYTWLPDI